MGHMGLESIHGAESICHRCCIKTVQLFLKLNFSPLQIIDQLLITKAKKKKLENSSPLCAYFRYESRQEK
jgi:hypothetical protein